MNPYQQNRYQPPQTESDADSMRINATKYMDMVIKEIITTIPNAIQSSRPLLEGMKAYNVNVESLEIICVANGWLNAADLEKYKNEIAEFKKSIDSNQKLGEGESVEYQARIAREKFRLLLRVILDHQTKFESMEI